MVWPVPTVPPCPEILVIVATETSKPVGNVTIILPFMGIGLAVVKVAVTAPDAPATKLAGETPALEIEPGVIDTALTFVSLSISTFALVVVTIVKVPVLPETGGFLMTPNTTDVMPAVSTPGVPPVPRVTVHI